MKNYRITVNGVAYEVTVEEIGAEEMTGAAPEPMKTKVPEVKKPAPKKAPAKTSGGDSGRTKINAPMPGKIVDVKVSAGTMVKKGDVVIILEAMKMENEICAAQDGKISSVEVSSGDMVESGAVLVTMD